LLFERRLQRDGLSIGAVLAKFANARRKASAPAPAWVMDAIWIEAALQSPDKAVIRGGISDDAEPCAFEHLLAPIVNQAEMMLWAAIEARDHDNFEEPALACLPYSLLSALSRLSTPAIYERFAKARKDHEPTADGMEPQKEVPTSRYDQFVVDMKAGGFRR